MHVSYTAFSVPVDVVYGSIIFASLGDCSHECEVVEEAETFAVMRDNHVKIMR